MPLKTCNALCTGAGTGGIAASLLEPPPSVILRSQDKVSACAFIAAEHKAPGVPCCTHYREQGKWALARTCCMGFWDGVDTGKKRSKVLAQHSDVRDRPNRTGQRRRPGKAAIFSAGD